MSGVLCGLATKLLPVTVLTETSMELKFTNTTADNSYFQYKVQRSKEMPLVPKPDDGLRHVFLGLKVRLLMP